MLQFLSSLFSPGDDRPAGLDESLINDATERVVEGTDKRLKGLGNYRRQLRLPVETALNHVMHLAESLPPPVEISRRTFGTDPRIHAFFASFEHLQEKIGASKNIDAYLKQAGAGQADSIFGLLSVQWQEVKRLGTVLQHDLVQREVLQVSVNFFNHNFIGPANTLEETVLNIKKRAFDFIIHIAMERIIAERSKRSELEVQKRLLQRKLSAMKGGNWGLEEMLRPEMSGAHDLARLTAEIESVESELSGLGASHEVLDRNMQIIKETLSRPQEVMAWRNIGMTLDRMNIKTDQAASARACVLELLEVYSGIGAARILLPGWYPASEVPHRGCSISEATRYL